MGCLVNNNESYNNYNFKKYSGKFFICLNCKNVHSMLMKKQGALSYELLATSKKKKNVYH